jgi:hypothetical protein
MDFESRVTALEILIDNYEANIKLEHDYNIALKVYEITKKNYIAAYKEWKLCIEKKEKAYILYDTYDCSNRIELNNYFNIFIKEKNNEIIALKNCKIYAKTIDLIEKYIKLF